MVGRRDAALVALICDAGMTRRHVRALRYPPNSQGDPDCQGEPDSEPGAIAQMPTSADPQTCPVGAPGRAEVVPMLSMGSLGQRWRRR